VPLKYNGHLLTTPRFNSLRYNLSTFTLPRATHIAEVAQDLCTLTIRFTLDLELGDEVGTSSWATAKLQMQASCQSSRLVYRGLKQAYKPAFKSPCF
jgi:hypothetical protein